jgi:uncharacterized protein (DUF3820 family)
MKELLIKLREMYLFDIDESGYPNASMSEIMQLWEDVNKAIEKQ